MSVYNDLNIGMGLQIVRIDLSASDPDLLLDLKRVSARLVYDEDLTLDAGFEVDGPAAVAAPTDYADPALWIAGVPGIMGSETKTYFQFSHTFKKRGLYFISVSIEDSNGNTTTAADAIRVGVGDGLPDGIQNV